MIPLRDVIPSRSTPVVTIGIIVLNAVVFAYQLSLGAAGQAFIFANGLVPSEFSLITLITSMFLHGGLMHFGGNMLYLWIFGDNVEDRMGHGRFVVFYLLCGVAAALAQTWANPNSPVPMVGASGAIAGVMGAYFVMYPRSRIVTLDPDLLLHPTGRDSGRRLPRVVVPAAVPERPGLSRALARRRHIGRHRVLGARGRIRGRTRRGARVPPARTAARRVVAR